MQKNLFLKKNNNRIYTILIFSFLFIIIFYFILFYISLNQKYFIINNNENIVYYVVPNDKEGEKVKFVDKKSINDLSSLKKDYKLSNIDNLEYTIQVYSDVKFENVMNYFNDLLSLKSDIILEEDFYIFSINTEIGDDYFLTYKNYDSKIEAFNNCKNLSFIKNCLILNP